MTEHDNNHESDNEKDKEKQDKKVDVSIDGKERKIRPGEYSLADLKDALKVDESKVLEQLINGQFTALKSTDTIPIGGGEVFSSHVPRGGSSWK